MRCFEFFLFPDTRQAADCRSIYPMQWHMRCGFFSSWFLSVRACGRFKHACDKYFFQSLPAFQARWQRCASPSQNKAKMFASLACTFHAVSRRQRDDIYPWYYAQPSGQNNSAHTCRNKQIAGRGTVMPFVPPMLAHARQNPGSGNPRQPNLSAMRMAAHHYSDTGGARHEFSRIGLVHND